MRDKEYARLTSREYYKKHSNKLKEINKKYRQRNPCQNRFYSMKSRCINPTNPSYRDYGAKGIKCEFADAKEIHILWLKYNACEMERPEIHRLDKKKNYNLENCIFVPKKYHKKFEKLSIKEQKKLLNKIMSKEK